MFCKKVLLIDDDAEFIFLTTMAFQKIGAQVVAAYNGSEGISKAYSHEPNLILLDVMMPGMSGFEVCHRIREFTNAPIIIITAFNQDRKMLQGLYAGADVFLSKPLKFDILLARARAVMRRDRQNGHQTDFDYDDGHLKIDVDKHRVVIDGRQIKFSPIEFRLLEYLVNHAERVLPFDEILDNVWGNEFVGSNDIVHVYLSHLRRKIEKGAKNLRYFTSIHGVGYVFEKQVFD
jgi:DNA-binding response OmpR family regulator